MSQPGGSNASKAGFVSAGSMVNRTNISTTHGRIPGKRVLPTISSRALPTLNRTASASKNSTRAPSAITASTSTSNNSRNSSPIPKIRTPGDQTLEKILKELQIMRQQIQARKNIRHPGTILSDTALKAVVS